MTTTTANHKVDPKLDLVLEREVPVPVEQVWAAWTQPELIKQWFAPKPFETVHAEVDLRPGGVFATTMRSPEGEEYPGAGCFLEVQEPNLLVWTSTLGPGYRPNASEGGPQFTAILTFEDDGNGGTRYRAVALHADPAGATAHADMGFVEGWGACLDQLVALMS